jgi:polar amino acid transport system substrate-binding protein
MGEFTERAFAMLKRRGLLGLGVAAGGVGGLLGARAAQAQSIDTSTSKLQQVLQRGHLVVGTGSTNPPWHFEDETGQLVGMDIDMARLIAKSLFDDPDKVEFVLQGSDARIPSLITDQVDVICQWMTITAGRAQQVEFTVPYYREGVSLLVMADGAKYTTFDSILEAGSAARSGRCRTSSSRTGCMLPCPRPRSTSSTARTRRSRPSTRVASTPISATSRRFAG